MLYVLASEAGAMLSLWHVLRVLEGGINMQDRSNLRCRPRSPM